MISKQVKPKDVEAVEEKAGVISCCVGQYGVCWLRAITGAGPGADSCGEPSSIWWLRPMQVLRSLSAQEMAFCCSHIITDPASAWFTRVGNITRELLWDVVDRIQRNVLIWYNRYIGPHILIKKFNEEEEVKHMCHACHLLATKYWKELETRGKEWLINNLKKEVKGLNVRVLAE